MGCKAKCILGTGGLCIGAWDMKTTIVTCGLGGRYPRGVARLIQSFVDTNKEISMMTWSGTLPPGAPSNVIEDGYDYTGYCAKPFAMRAAVNDGADIVIWLDASVRAIRSIQPLIDHIAEHGYYLAPNGFTIGEWSNDKTLAHFGYTRDEALLLPECASGIVGLDLRSPNMPMAAMLWRWASEYSYFPGHHSNSMAADKKHHYKNVGWVSDDPRCSGHRHDQTVLSLLAHQLGLTNWVPWPKFVAYQAGYSAVPGQSGAATEETCLLIEGV